MAVFPAIAAIRSLAALNLVLAYFLLTSPLIISENSFVFILGAAMDVPQALSFSKPSGVSAFLAAALTLLGITDLTASLRSDEAFISFWGAQAPMRTLFFLILTAYSFFSSTKNTGIRAMSDTPDPHEGAGESLANSVTFTWGFLNTLLWFWIYSALRDEKMEALARISRQRKAANEKH